MAETLPKTSRYSLACLFALATICAAQAQVGLNVSDHLLIERTRKAISGSPEEKYEGSPYMNDQFIEAHVYSGDKIFRPVLMRYDIFHDVMEFQDGNRTLLLDPDPRITRIEMGNQTFVVQEFKVRGKNQNSFVELLEKGTLTLLAKSNVNYRKGNDFGSIPANYSRSADVYYCRLDNEAIFKVTSMNKMLEHLAGKRPALSQFVKEQDLSADSKDDLRKVVQYFNSLASSP